jgi:hypothetical protein
LPNDSLAGEKYFTVKELEIFRVKNQDWILFLSFLKQKISYNKFR